MGLFGCARMEKSNLEREVANAKLIYVFSMKVRFSEMWHMLIEM